MVGDGPRGPKERRRANSPWSRRLFARPSSRPSSHGHAPGRACAPSRRPRHPQHGPAGGEPTTPLWHARPGRHLWPRPRRAAAPASAWGWGGRSLFGDELGSEGAAGEHCIACMPSFRRRFLARSLAHQPAERQDATEEAARPAPASRAPVPPPAPPYRLAHPARTHEIVARFAHGDVFLHARRHARVPGCVEGNEAMDVGEGDLRARAVSVRYSAHLLHPWPRGRSLPGLSRRRRKKAPRASPYPT